MKFFTRAWTHGELTEEQSENIWPAYQRHLDTLDLPQPVRELARFETHDAYILEAKFQTFRKVLHLRLRCGDLRRGYFDARLDFAGATIEPDELARIAAATRPGKYEIMHDELDRLDIDEFKYRLLLFPDGEIAFSFRDVVIVRQNVANRQAP